MNRSTASKVRTFYIPDRDDLIVVADINGGNVNGVVEAPIPVAGGIELARGFVVHAGFVEGLRCS